MSPSSETRNGRGAVHEDVQEIESVRSRLLNGWLSVLFILGFPAALSGAIQAEQQGMRAHAIAYLCIYTVFLGGILASRKSSSILRSLVLVLSLFTIAVVVMTRIGLSGVADMLLVGVCVSAGVLLGLRIGLLTVGVCVATMSIIGAGMIHGSIPIEAERMMNSQTPMAWITTLVTFTMIAIGLIISPDMLQRRLLKSLKMLRKHSEDTENANRLLREEIQRRHQVQEALKASEEQLRHIQRMEAIGTLAGGIAHDFNNLLAAIMGYAELALMESTGDERLRSHLNQVLTAGKRGKSLVDQILAFSRQSGQERWPMDLKSVVREGLGFARATLPTTIEIREDIRLESAVAFGNPTQIHQVLMNLCTNAGHAMEDRGGVLEVCLTEVEVASRTEGIGSDLAPGSYLKLTVRDTGHGMDRAILARIFDPFFTTKERGRGTGMGLAVVHGIVKAHGGDISVESEVGRGTSFHVFLPTSPKEEGLPLIETGEPSGAESARILFVDDEQAIVDLGNEMLERMGHQVVGRTNSVEALEVFRDQPNRFDLVITDLTMPNMTGIDLVERLLEIRSDIPIVLCTGFSEPIDPKRAEEMGIRATLRKPFLMSRLREAVRKALA